MKRRVFALLLGLCLLMPVVVFAEYEEIAIDLPDVAYEEPVPAPKSASEPASEPVPKPEPEPVAPTEEQPTEEEPPVEEPELPAETWEPETEGPSEDIPDVWEPTEDGESTDAPAEEEPALKPWEEANAVFVYERDLKGKLILDKENNPTPILSEGDLFVPVLWEHDKNGELILDESGEPIVLDCIELKEPWSLREEDESESSEETGDENASEPEASDEAASGAQAPAFAYERDKYGDFVLDANGNPVVILPEGATMRPVVWQRDEDGFLVLDDNGNPVVLEYGPVTETAEEFESAEAGDEESQPEPEEEPQSETEEEADPEAAIAEALEDGRRVDITAKWLSEESDFGDECLLTAVPVGYDSVVYDLQWQTSADGEVWTNVEGATGATYVHTVTKENCHDFWRVEITITDIK